MSYLKGEPAPAPGPLADAAAAPLSLSLIIGRIEDAVEAETTGLKTDRQFDLKASNARKSRYLYELTRAMRSAGDIRSLDEYGVGLRRLREKLARNEAAIRAHLAAVNEVATLMQDAIRRSETDGTYSEAEFGYGA